MNLHLGAHMPTGTRQEGRVALWDFFFSEAPPIGWRDGHVFALGLGNYQFKTPLAEANEPTREARRFLVPGYQKGDPYPHVISVRPEPLFAILHDIRIAKGIDEQHDVSSQWVRPTAAKLSLTENKAVLVSGNSRDMMPTIDPNDVNWNLMHYDELLLTPEIYLSIVSLDKLAFLKALGIRVSALSLGESFFFILKRCLF